MTDLIRDVWQIVQTDNYARDHIADRLIMKSYMKKETAEAIAALLNEDIGQQSSHWFVVRGKDAPLWRGMDEYV
jgi:hypothetical protein